MATKAGRELPKWERTVVNQLVAQGWRYAPPTGKRAKVIPPNPKMPIVVVSVAGANPCGQRNLLATIQRAGGIVKVGS